MKPAVETWIDATVERLRHTEAAHLTAPLGEIMSPSGFPTGVKYRKIDSPIDHALYRHWISEREWMAGEKFMANLYGSKLESRLIANLDSPVDGRRTDMISDYRIKCRQTLNQSLQSLPQKARSPWLDWTSQSMVRDTGIADLGAYFSSAKTYGKLLAKGKKELEKILDQLARHWGL
jgi:hypothetical protein